jgi:hypothetical protein
MEGYQNAEKLVIMNYSQCSKAFVAQSEPGNQGVLTVEFVELEVGCHAGCPGHEQEMDGGFEYGEQHFFLWRS